MEITRILILKDEHFICFITDALTTLPTSEEIMVKISRVDAEKIMVAARGSIKVVDSVGPPTCPYRKGSKAAIAWTEGMQAALDSIIHSKREEFRIGTLHERSQLQAYIDQYSFHRSFEGTGL